MRKLTMHKHMREINGHKRNFRKFFNFRKYSKIMLQLSYNVYVNTIYKYNICIRLIQITVSKDLQPEIKY